MSNNVEGPSSPGCHVAVMVVGGWIVTWRSSATRSAEDVRRFEGVDWLGPHNLKLSKKMNCLGAVNDDGVCIAKSITLLLKNGMVRNFGRLFSTRFFIQCSIQALRTYTMLLVNEPVNVWIKLLLLLKQIWGHIHFQFETNARKDMVLKVGVERERGGRMGRTLRSGTILIKEIKLSVFVSRCRCSPPVNQPHRSIAVFSCAKPSHPAQRRL